MGGPVERVLILGRDAAAWLSALALHRAVGPSGVEVRVVETPSRLAAADVYCGLPMLGGLHDLLVIDESKLLRAVAGVPVLGQRFSDWGGARAPFLHAWDTHGAAFGGVDFLQHWLKARELGLRGGLEDFSLGAAAAKRGRRLIASEAVRAYSRALNGYHLSAQHYAGVLRGVALKRGVLHAQGLFRNAVLDEASGAISALVLADGRRFEADLFVDATGAEAALIGGVMDAPFEDWSRWLPCDRLLAASAERLPSIPAFAQISAFRAGWSGIFPLQDRTAVVCAWRAGEVPDAEMLRIAGVLSGLKFGGEAVADAFRPGARATPWVKNCVAVGEAAVALDPLDALQLHPVHIGLSQLVELFPVAREPMVEAREYNRVMGSAAARMRDFQIARFKLNGRFDEPFWDGVREMEVPDALAHKLELFRACGRLAMDEDETFEEDDWTSLFVGSGLIPRSSSPLVELCPEQERIARFQQMLHVIRSEVEKMPSLDAYLELL